MIRHPDAIIPHSTGSGTQSGTWEALSSISSSSASNPTTTKPSKPSKLGWSGHMCPFDISFKIGLPQGRCQSEQNNIPSAWAPLHHPGRGCSQQPAAGRGEARRRAHSTEHPYEAIKKPASVFERNHKPTHTYIHTYSTRHIQTPT